MKEVIRVILGVLVVVMLTGNSIFAKAGGPPYEIKWYFIGNGQQRDVKLIEAAANRYLKDKINTRIKLQCYTWGDEYNNRMQMKIASGEPFDICFTSSWANHYRQNVARGAFLDITELAPKYAPQTWRQLHPSFKVGSAVDGRNYAIPANKELAHQWGFMFRKEIVAKYHFDLSKIKRFRDIEPYLKIVKEKEPGMIPLQNVGGETGFLTLDYDRIGDDRCPGVLYNDSKEMKVFNELETPEFNEYLKVVRRFYLDGYIPKEAASQTNDFTADRRAGKVFAWIESLKPFCDEERTTAWGFPCIQVELTPPVVQTRDCIGSMQAISRTSKNPYLALRFLEWVNTDKYLNNLLNFGIEGKHYRKAGPNVIGFPRGVTSQNSGYRPGTGWMFGNQYLNYFWEGENQKKWDAFRKFNADSVSAGSLGFSFDNEPVSTEVAACMNVWNEYMNGLLTGAADPGKVLPQALAKFTAAGLDRVISEKQKQLDAWLEKQKKQVKK
jgi:putative aldouronate transport system substrate-binding protein